MKVYVIAYDIPDDHVREQISKILLRYGERVQYSVFEVTLRSETQLKDLCEQLKKTAPKDANIRLYRLCEDCRRASRTLDGENITRTPAVVIL